MLYQMDQGALDDDIRDELTEIIVSGYPLVCSGLPHVQGESPETHSL